MLAITGADLVSYVLAGGAMVGGLGYAWGQFRSSKSKAANDALATALQENAVGRIRGDRLEAELHNMTQEKAELRVENTSLRTLISSGAHLSPDLVRVLDETAKKAVEELKKVAHEEHEKTRASIARITRGG